MGIKAKSGAIYATKTECRMLGLLLLAATASAQSDRGTITGTVTDQARAVIPNAKILATNTETQAQFETATTGTGNYTLPQLPAGEYDLSVSAAGFSTYHPERTHDSGGSDRAHRRDPEGRRGDRVRQRHGRRTVAENGKRGAEHQYNHRTIRRAPFVSASGQGGAAALINPWAFTTIMPGASIASSGGSNINLRVNGLPNNTFTTRIDGQDATFTQQESFSAGSQPSVEALEEVALQTSNFSAEYGQVGGGLYNFTSKSGTNKLHGSGFEYFRNEFLNAGQPFTNSGNGHLIRPWRAVTITALHSADPWLSRTSITAGTRPSFSSVWNRIMPRP